MNIITVVIVEQQAKAREGVSVLQYMIKEEMQASQFRGFLECSNSLGRFPVSNLVTKSFNACERFVWKMKGSWHTQTYESRSGLTCCAHRDSPT